MLRPLAVQGDEGGRTWRGKACCSSATTLVRRAPIHTARQQRPVHFTTCYSITILLIKVHMISSVLSGCWVTTLGNDNRGASNEADGAEKKRSHRRGGEKGTKTARAGLVRRRSGGAARSLSRRGGGLGRRGGEGRGLASKARRSGALSSLGTKGCEQVLAFAPNHEPPKTHAKSTAWRCRQSRTTWQQGWRRSRPT